MVTRGWERASLESLEGASWSDDSIDLSSDKCGVYSYHPIISFNKGQFFKKCMHQYNGGKEIC